MAILVVWSAVHDDLLKGIVLERLLNSTMFRQPLNEERRRFSTPLTHTCVVMHVLLNV